ncbi:nucleolar protein 8 [Perognathus longimembris pacificus]|uniref:nucleolar protein 8 n=1 Tax=Perognathus longimembris pacificus TaxID=214514 RepID=UPI002018E645|nr:nucleolar protein 8 [Perognathus longimembris pacificus]XP_048201075.1 nucleolar protein 8 [Perognathus longimembris pacificus]XP_048201155.1 nucleolar protein 8 [Perognathus longimembris pacificus]XP_048201233.1 nucleolar protein 8 [Perognathus longimembris pacificus]
MKANRETKRLFVGGLSQAISETDLQNQFSRFGDVSEVEIITRKDEQGSSQKVFAYVNINIAEADLKKCMSILNKTKWKGGTLQIQLAKESFLHRLAQEREEAKVKKEKSKTSNFSGQIGGMDFHMKAVPGTEVPGHKNWVVSKFGRVLPVLHLKNQHKHKIMKYDPSKYCHNLKKIAEDFTNTIPISSLTWELEGGNDPMSKKRRGEFSEFHGPPQKMIKVQKGEDCTSSRGSAIIQRASCRTDNNTSTQQKTTQKIACDPVTPSKSFSVHDVPPQKPQNVHFQTFSLQSSQRKNSMSDDDIDSEDELKMMIAEEKNLQRVICSSVNDSENEPFEIVKDDFKLDVHKTNLGINNDACYVSENTAKNDSEYDSSDTDEIIAMKKNSKVRNSEEFSKTETSIQKKTSFKKKELFDHCIKVQKRKKKQKSVLSHGVTLLNHNPLSNSSSSSSDDESESDEEYKAMMENCSRINLTLADLEQLVGTDQKIPEKDAETYGPEITNHCKSDIASKNPKTPSNLYRHRQCISPEEIVASLLEEENTYDNQKTKEKNLKPKFQAFKGVGCLYEEESVKKKLKKTVASNNVHEDPSSLKHEHPNSISGENRSPYTNDPSACQSAKKVDGPNHIQPQFTLENKDHKIVSANGLQNGGKTSCLLPLKSKKSLTMSVKTHEMGFDKDTSHSTKNQEKASEEEGSNSSSLTSLVKLSKISPSKDKKSTSDFSLSISNSSDVITKDKHAEDNQKRLAALEARQKTREVQKKLVHSALANLDGHPEKKSSHIIFGSDGESETDETPAQEQNHPGEKLVKESMGKTTGKLFDSSDNEESDSEDDSDRFRIKPQFEGRAGQKLMNLQSHFGGDDRFRMDSRFLESDSEEEQEEVNEKKSTEEDELAAEKKKALNVVQSVLHTNLNNPLSKGPATKKFKDVIHYDPTRHDHATYERKMDDKTKDSKAKRKKKREEAEKLPEVSKEMYYDIAMDLKEMFQNPKDTNEEDIPQKEDSSGEMEESHHSAAQTSGDIQPSGFTFSFFDSDTKDENEESYRVEALKTGKTVWQTDPRFQDSSSEEEDVTEEVDHGKPSPGEEILTENETIRFFFFSKNDKRLHGTDLFWSGVGNNMSKNAWEARTNNLLMECRKKHKEAKRKVKPK